jgi:DinB superfamily
MAETPQQYKQRMLANVARQNPSRVRAASAGKLSRLIRGAAPQRLRRRPAPEKWSVVEILAHLADVELAVGYRIRAILGSPGTAIAAFDQDAWAAQMRYGKRNAKQALAAFRALRENNELLLQSLRPEQWEHFGMHAERGPESVRNIAEMIAGHDLNHIRQIEAILKRPKKAR